MKRKSVEYLAELLPDGHLSLPDEIRKKLKRMSAKKVKVSIELQDGKAGKDHPAFGIWSDRVAEGGSAEIAESLRKGIESRTDAR